MIYFVGAGPGADDLITVRGQALLKKADCVIYAGSLVNPALLSVCPAGCEILNSASMTLDEVVSVMARRRRDTVVRLHTGDPAVFGAIREQIDRLKAQNIAFEIVPGVSSLFAAAAALEAEYTLPGVSQTVMITRMEGRTPVPSGQSIASLAAHRATMVIFLSVHMLEALCRELIRGGYEANTPAAIVYKASWPDEKIIRGNLTTLPELGRDIQKTALVVVGDFLGDAYELSKLYDPAFSHAFRKAER